ncbi:hypothetical protein LTR54_018208, partial [Friedmanniomyces endolithicus]
LLNAPCLRLKKGLEMDRLVNGAMKEASGRCAEIRDISVEDFTRFCEYAYRGDYAVPVHTIDETRLAAKIVEDSSNAGPPDHRGDDLDPAVTSIVVDTAQAESAQGIEDWSALQSKKPKTPKLSKKSAFRTKYHSRIYLSSDENEAEIANQFKPRCNTTDEQDFTPVFLAHARLYTFARMRMIDNLKALTLQKLHNTLIGFRLYENRVRDIVELARYAYTSEHIPDRTDDGETDELRNLVVNYIASEFDCIGGAAIFVAFLEEGGEFVGDFWNTVLNGLL